ncbi:type II secretion system inner membrane protein GspF [Pleionea sp. CnH1-48]|uniref:type II secretion system inner membrane protein GspF n=1 Tax=Pleionea sp. CnH1-48 TaxID=2954494 RepID=UPI002097026B|nr:type II secretion system inner membrane protein GspF [Pleionea sp. CnH1-48]MCO7225202.1 type II secretion system inner membrane protein GspF [Pleionea sp. CnH1-48]
MAAFEYIALNEKGRQKKGILEGDTPKQIRQSLRDKGMVPLSVEAVTEKHRKQSKSESFFSSANTGRMSASDLALITQQLATLINAAIPIEEAIKAVAEQCEKAKQKTIMMGVRSRVVEGHSLADALREYPKIFDDLYCSMVAAGEKSGHLDEVLDRLADYTQKRQELRSKVSSALAYPMILAVVSFGVIAFLLSYVVPSIVEQYRDMGGELPGITQIMIAASDFVINWGLFVLVGLVLAIMGMQLLLRNSGRKKSWHRLILKLPLFGKVARGINAARFARTLSILNSSAVPLLGALKIAGEVMTNLELREAVHDATLKVREGTSLKIALAQSGYFPPMMLHMIASGESSGELDRMLEKAADNQDRQFETLVGVITTAIGPIMILFMGGFVLTIVLAILLPIFQMNELMSG